MKFRNMSLVTGLMLLGAFSAHGQSATYVVTIKNASSMPLSPGVAYVKTGGEASAAIGSQPTMGFVQLCQTGNNTTRANELRMESGVSQVAPTTAMIQPGQSTTLEIPVGSPEQQSLHFEVMYGKSKDICGVASINSHSLVALRQHVSSEVVLTDRAVVTGVFTDPTFPKGMSYPYPGTTFCADAMDAIACLRELSTSVKTIPQIRYFAGYFPSLITALEMKYGSDDVRTLLLPPAGAIEVSVKLRH